MRSVYFRTTMFTVVLLLLGLTTPAACGGGSAISGTSCGCAPKDQQGCACPGGAQGVHTCKADCSAWNACQCGGAGGGSGATGSSSGSGGSGGGELDGTNDSGGPSILGTDSGGGPPQACDESSLPEDGSPLQVVVPWLSQRPVNQPGTNGGCWSCGPEVPAGCWNGCAGSCTGTRYCGPASALMISAWANQTTPTSTDLYNAGLWGSQQWPGWQLDCGSGDYTNADQLVSLLAGSLGFAPSNVKKTTKATACTIRDALAQGHPTIIHTCTQLHAQGETMVTGGGSHWMVARGISKSYIWVNDPGRGTLANGQRKFKLSSFEAIWNGGTCDGKSFGPDDRIVIEAFVGGNCPAAASCAGLSCGPDPVCGTSCGTCPGTQTCTAAGACVSMSASPCAGLPTGDYCGDDPQLKNYAGAGSDLVHCQGGTVGTVTPCAAPNTCTIAPGGQNDTCSCTPSCGGKACGTSNGCSGTCTVGDGCICTPSCGGKACGTSDGCGGTCTAGDGCVCTPSCGGKACGASNGCGGTCLAGGGCICTTTYAIDNNTCPTDLNGAGGQNLFDVCGTVSATGAVTIQVTKVGGGTFGNRPYQVRVSGPGDPPCGPSTYGFISDASSPAGIGTSMLTFQFQSSWGAETQKYYCVTASTVPGDVGYNAGDLTQQSWWYSGKIGLSKTCQ